MRLCDVTSLSNFFTNCKENLRENLTFFNSHVFQGGIFHSGLTASNFLCWGVASSCQMPGDDRCHPQARTWIAYLPLEFDLLIWGSLYTVFLPSAVHAWALNNSVQLYIYLSSILWEAYGPRLYSPVTNSLVGKIKLRQQYEESIWQGTKSVLSMFMALAVSTLVIQGRENLLEFSGEAPGFRNQLITNQRVLE